MAAAGVPQWQLADRLHCWQLRRMAAMGAATALCCSMAAMQAPAWTACCAVVQVGHGCRGWHPVHRADWRWTAMVDSAPAGVPGLGVVRALRYKCGLHPCLWRWSPPQKNTKCLPQTWTDHHAWPAAAQPKLQPSSRHCVTLQSLSQVLACCVVQARYPLPLQVGLPVSIAIFATVEGARYRNWLRKGEGGEWPEPVVPCIFQAYAQALCQAFASALCKSAGRHKEKRL